MKLGTRLTIIAAVLVAGAAGGFLYARSQARQPPGPEALLRKAVHLEPVKRAPNFALPDLDGHLHALSQWRGKVRLLNFWATWCGPCRKEVPALVALQQRYRGRLAVIGIATDEPNTTVVKAFADKFKINYPLLMDNGHATDIARHLGFNLIGLPATVLMDGDANIIGYHLGPIDADSIEKKIKKLLNGRKSATKEAELSRN
ncbi:MAG TPA: TlpA disulfide reductase family protein [Gammaproteobacteria bacterium]|nr:TlpA disulfide reductase family protein [Gammaproteobacteria bacterium]